MKNLLMGILAITFIVSSAKADLSIEAALANKSIQIGPIGLTGADGLPIPWLRETENGITCRPMYPSTSWLVGCPVEIYFADGKMVSRAERLRHKSWCSISMTAGQPFAEAQTRVFHPKVNVSQVTRYGRSVFITAIGYVKTEFGWTANDGTEVAPGTRIYTTFGVSCSEYDYVPEYQTLSDLKKTMGPFLKVLPRDPSQDY